LLKLGFVSESIGFFSTASTWNTVLFGEHLAGIHAVMDFSEILRQLGTYNYEPQ
jgi:hypothetical protein